MPSHCHDKWETLPMFCILYLLYNGSIQARALCAAWAPAEIRQARAIHVKAPWNEGRQLQFISPSYEEQMMQSQSHQEQLEPHIFTGFTKFDVNSESKNLYLKVPRDIIFQFWLDSITQKQSCWLFIQSPVQTWANTGSAETKLHCCVRWTSTT